MKTYKIGEIAKMLGISSETIRNYEKKGLIKPYKEEESHYRFYDIIQINYLINLQRFQKYGYSLHEIGEIMKTESIPEMTESLKLKEERILQEAFYMQLKLESMHANIQCLKEAQSAKQGCFLGQRPALYRINYQKNHELVQEEGVQRELVKWLEHSDITFMSGSVSLENLLKGENSFDFGLCMDEKTAKFLKIEENETVKFYESCPAIVFYYEAKQNSDFQDATKMLLDFAKENQFILNGESVSRVLLARWQDEESYFISHLVWVPYKKIKKRY